MNPYMVYAGDDPAEGALLVFAHNTREAKRIAWRTVEGWTGCGFTDVVAKRIFDAGPVMGLKQSDEPHVIDNPPSCKSCNLWGREMVDGRCDSCREFDE